MGTAQRREQSGRYIVCKRESERCGRCISKFSALYECATTRRPQGKCQELYWFADGIQRPGPDVPYSLAGYPRCPSFTLSDRIGCRCGRCGLDRTNPAVLCGALRSPAADPVHPVSRIARDLLAQVRRAVRGNQTLNLAVSWPGRTDRAESPRHEQSHRQRQLLWRVWRGVQNSKMADDLVPSWFLGARCGCVGSAAVACGCGCGDEQRDGEQGQQRGKGVLGTKEKEPEKVFEIVLGRTPTRPKQGR
jgi:hypothetical protein